MRLLPVLPCVITALLLAGCSGADGPSLHPVSGNVTYQGKPLAAGRIVFVPDRTQADSGPVQAAEILNGKYEAKVTTGKKTVEIHASLPTGAMGTREDGSQYEEMVGLPEKYNAESKLEVTIESGKNENIDFKLD